MELIEVYRTYERTEPTIGVLMSSPVPVVVLVVYGERTFSIAFAFRRLSAGRRWTQELADNTGTYVR
jgi:hypothetical protein